MRPLWNVQVKELQAFRNEMSRHSAAFETSKSLGDSFLSACDVDKEGVTGELLSTKQQWEKMNAAVLERSQSLEDIGQRLAEFTELLRDSQHAMQRCEDRLSSHDALGAAARDSKLLDRIRTLLDEVFLLEKGVDRVQQYASGLVADAATHQSDASHIQDQADGLSERYTDLRSQLEDRCSTLETASQAVLQFNVNPSYLSPHFVYYCIILHYYITLLYYIIILHYFPAPMNASNRYLNIPDWRDRDQFYSLRRVWLFQNLEHSTYPFSASFNSILKLFSRSNIF